MLETTTKVPKSACPGCGFASDEMTAIVDGVRPSAGDYSICFRCAALLVITADLTPRLMEPEEFTALSPTMALEIGRIRQAVATLRSGESP